MGEKKGKLRIVQTVRQPVFERRTFQILLRQYAGRQETEQVRQVTERIQDIKE
jgi:hypothetical protein